MKNTIIKEILNLTVTKLLSENSQSSIMQLGTELGIGIKNNPSKINRELRDELIQHFQPFFDELAAEMLLPEWQVKNVDYRIKEKQAYILFSIQDEHYWVFTLPDYIKSESGIRQVQNLSDFITYYEVENKNEVLATMRKIQKELLEFEKGIKFTLRGHYDIY